MNAPRRRVAAVLLAALLALIGPALPARAVSPTPQTLYQLPANAQCTKGFGNCTVYPKAAALPSGRLVAAFEKATVGPTGSAAGQVIPVYRSDDDGTTWQWLSDVPAPAGTKYTSSWTNPYFYVLPQNVGSLTAGTLLLATVVSGEDVYYTEHKAADPNWVPTNDGDRRDMAIGIRFTDGVTAFPATIVTAATWNEKLAYVKGAAQADEAFGKGKNVILAPGLASGRTPLSGRTPEYLGEDALLSGLLAAAGTRGIQSDGRVLATPKHYVANEQETDRQTSSSNADERTLRQVYDLPFEIATKRGDPASIMCSYNQINGVYACEHPRLNTVLKDDIGFGGYVMSDFGSVHSTAASLVNGLDQELNRPIWFTPARLDAALAAGEITQRQIDAAALRVVTAYIRGGLFDNPLPATPIVDASTAAHKAIARTVAEQGSVLLKNDRNTLPLKPRRGQTIALIGPTASGTPTAGVSAHSVCSLPWRFGNPTTMRCEDLVSPEDGIRARAARAGVTVTFDDGSDPASAATAAAAADVAVVFGYQRAGEFTDLTDLRLQGGGDALIATVAAANDRTIVVLQTGSAVEMPWIDQVPAVLETWYGGEQMGTALAALLFGDVSPSGKLPMTFPRSLADTPTAGDPARYPGVRADGATIRQVDYSEGLKVGYRWYASEDIDPLFSFGHGLSYTSFAYSRLDVRGDGRDGVRIRFRLTNTGQRAGTEVAQAYVTLPSSTGEPAHRLVGWSRVTLGAGSSRTVEIALTRSDLADLHLLQYYDTSRGGWVTARGTYQIGVGGSSGRTAVTGSLTVGPRG